MIGRQHARWSALQVLLAAALAPALPAAEWTLTPRPETTKVQFTLGATLHTVRGTAALEGGTIHFDPATGAISGELVVDATSADTGNENRDRDMHAKVLESGLYPRVVLRPRAMVGTLALAGASRVEIEGDLEIHGGVHPITVPVEARVEGEEVVATAHFTIPYVEWGMLDPSKFLIKVKKVVEVRVDLRGTLAQR